MLIMLSGGYREDNPEIYNLMDRSKKIVYIPSWYGEEAYRDYKDFKEQLPNSNVIYFPINKRPTVEKIKELKSCDLIYFDGGNTFYILNQLINWNLVSLIKKLSRSKVIVGMSAGSILQTPNINLAQIPYFNADDNDVRLEDLSGLNNVSFEIYPHFSIRNKKELKELTKYSKTHKRKIYLLPDGSSIIKKKGRVKFVGKSYLLHKGILCEN